MGPAARTDLDGAELAGYRSLWAAAPAAVATAAGIEEAGVPGVHCTAVAACPDVRFLTRALGFAGDAAVLDAVEAFFAARPVTGHVGLPAGHPAEALLAGRGHAPSLTWTKFARGVEPPAHTPTDLRIAPVGRADAPAMDAVIRRAFALPDVLTGWFGALPGRPGWHCLGAYDGDALVGTGSLFVHGATGWLTWGATDPAHRGRGAQGALFAARIAAARGLGVRLLVTETGAPGADGPGPSYRNILRSGFDAVHDRRLWRLAG